LLNRFFGHVNAIDRQASSEKLVAGARFELATFRL
jgi:hypothetical protein